MTDYPTLIEKLERSHGGVPCVATAEIRRLIADNEALRKANLDCVDHYNDARAEIELLRTQVAELSKDAERLDWLEKNLFHRENVDWITGKLSESQNMWVTFTPVGVQGAARTIIDAAIDAQKGKV